MKKTYKHIDSISPQIVELQKQGVQIRSKSWSKGSQKDNRSLRRQNKQNLKREM